MNSEALTILNTRPFVGTFSDYVKTLNTPYRSQKVTFKLFKKGKKTDVRKGKPKVTYSVALVTAFFAAENENRQLEDLPRADFSRLPERFLSVRTKSINDNL